jgi:hypothetical protein
VSRASHVSPRLSFAIAVAVALGYLIPSIAAAQARPTRLIISVADQTGAILPGATVTITGDDGKALAPVVTDGDGTATFTGVAPGRYRMAVEFPGFENRQVPDVRVRAGDNKQGVVLSIEKLQDTVTVGQDERSAAADPRGRAFGSALTREQIDALSDDPDEARRQLQEMVGGNAVVRVDSFEGAQLPPKSQIRSIRVSRDAFAAEFHQGGGIFVDIVTQPGGGPTRGGFQYRLRDGSMSGRSPFIPTKGPERTQDYQTNVSGTLVRNKVGYSLSFNGTSAFETPNLNAALVGGTRSEALSLRTPRDSLNGSGSLDWAVTRDQVMRIGYLRNRNSVENQGIGLYDLPERAFSTENSLQQFRLQEIGPLGRRFFMNHRLFILRQSSSTTPSVEAPTIRVQDAFNAGGAQNSGGRSTTNVNVSSDVDYVRGIHSVRMGLVVDASSIRSDQQSNYLGTYVFTSLADYEAGLPLSYTRRIGDPNIDYFNLTGGLYIQDDIRVRPGLTLSPGLRYEAQTHLRDYNNVGPRFGVTWAPSRSGRTTLRGSAGVFYDWLGTNTYEQTLRVDGFRQREINIPVPSYPDPGPMLVAPPVNRYLLGEVRMPRNARFSGGIDQQLNRVNRVSLTYSHMTGRGLFRGVNLNAPVDGVRPNLEFQNIVETVADGHSRQDSISVNFDGGLAQIPPVVGSSAPLIDWRRIRFFTNYTIGWLRNDTSGDFALAPGPQDDEWGYAPGDVRHRGGAGINAQVVRNLITSLNFNASSGAPYTLLTGTDSNGDLVLSERPAGVERNTERATGQWSLNMNASYAIPFGRRATPPPPGIAISISGNAAPTVQTVNIDWRYRMQFFVQVQNLTNRYNYIGYSGNQTSPFFGRPTSVANPRKIDMGISLSF